MQTIYLKEAELFAGFHDLADDLILTIGIDTAASEINHRVSDWMVDDAFDGPFFWW